MTPAETSEESILLVLPVMIYQVGDELYYDRQGGNGLRLWLENFKSVTLCCPSERRDIPPADTMPLSSFSGYPGLRVVTLPKAWGPLAFARALPGAVRTLRRLIGESRYLLFMIGGLWGDWASVGALVAARHRRSGAVWTDRVESDVMRFQAQDYRGVRRIYRLSVAWATRHYERLVIRLMPMGLFHGMETFSAYSPFCRHPHLVHDIHLGAEYRIGQAELVAKAGRAQGRPLRIVYVGRVHGDKGVQDWIDSLSAALDRGVGPLREYALGELVRRGLTDRIDFPGPVSDRAVLTGHLREADIFLFCHKTPESPRCLVEALLSGTPIVGYNTLYPRDLIAQHGGGMLVPPDDTQALADSLVALWKDRAQLALLCRRAARDGFPMIDTEVFHHRSELIKNMAVCL
jgi:colanic acid/amylovoran biosynthesis glycosyltransferase